MEQNVKFAGSKCQIIQRKKFNDNGSLADDKNCQKTSIHSNQWRDQSKRSGASMLVKDT